MQMRKEPSFRMNHRFPALSLVGLCILSLPVLVSAGTFYHCTDKTGNETLSDYPLDGHACRQIRIQEEMTSPRGGNKAGMTGASSDGRITEVTIQGNVVLVPTTLMNGGKEVAVRLLLDTGASGTTISSEIADRLSLRLSEAKKIEGRVVGGGIIAALMIMIDSLTVGPHVIQNLNIFVVPHEGVAARYDGLLGMDVLRELKYKVDFKRQVIIWE